MSDQRPDDFWKYDTAGDYGSPRRRRSRAVFYLLVGIAAIAALIFLWTLHRSEPMREVVCVDIGGAMGLGCGDRR